MRWCVVYLISSLLSPRSPHDNNPFKPFRFFFQVRSQLLDSTSSWSSYYHLDITHYHYYSPIKRASRATALRADGLSHTMGLVLTQTISPTHWTRSQNPPGASPPLTIQLLKKDFIQFLVRKISTLSTKRSLTLPRSGYWCTQYVIRFFKRQ